MLKNDPYRALFESSPHPMWVVEPETLRFLAVNPAALSIHGLPKDAFLSMTLRDLTCEPDKARLDDLAKRMASQSDSVQSIGAIRLQVRKGATPTAIEIHFNRVTLGDRPAWLGSIQQTTGLETLAAGNPAGLNRDRLIAALRREQEENRHILDHVPVMIWYKDAESRILRVNQPAADSMGLRVSDIEGRSTYELYPDEAARYHADDLEVIHTGQPKLGIVEQLTTGTGEKRWVQTDKFPYRDASGAIIGVTVFAQDITERKEAHLRLERTVEERTREIREAYDRLKQEISSHELTSLSLRASQDSTREMMNQASDAIFISDATGRFLDVNLRATQLLGYSRDDLLQLSIIDTYPPGELPHAAGRRDRLLRGETLQFERPMKRRDGTYFPAEISVSRLRDGRNLGIVRDVTHRVRSEQSLRESESKFRALTETVAAAAFIFQESRLLYVNPAAETVTGYTQDELLRMNFWDVIDPEHQASIQKHIVAAQGNSTLASRYEVKIRTKSGDLRWVEFTAGIITFQGKPAILGTAFDITQRKQAEDALRHQTQILQSILDSMGEAVVVADRNGKFLLWNPAAEKILGRMFADGNPGQWSERFGIFEIDQITRFPSSQLPLYRAIHGEDSDDVEMYLPRTKARVGAFLQVNGRPLRNEAGQITGGLIVFRDITERKRAEEELRRSEQRNAAILNAVPDLMFRLSRHGRFLDFKANKPEDLRLKPVEFMNQTIRKAMPPDFARKCQYFIENTLRTGTMQFFEYQLPMRDGLRDYEARLVVSGPDEVLAMVRDITSRKQLERQILEISDREQRRIGQDLHDGLCQHLIGTAFAGKILEQKLAEKHLAEAGDAREIVELIEQGISQARTMARGLYPVQLESGGLVPAIEQLASNVHKLFDVPCACKCDPTIRITDRAVTTHLYRIAQEAINNGIKHGKADRFRIHLARSRSGVTLTIHNNGRSFPRHPRASQGMGLNIMRHRAQMIGAMVEVRRGTKRGTKVICTLPDTGTHEAKQETTANPPVA